MAFDAAVGKIVLFGGQDGFGKGAFNDTWTWDGSSWTREADDGAPATRSGAQMVYDEVAKTALLYGGAEETQDPPPNANVSHAITYTDTWRWDGRWTQVASEPRISSPVMAYDAARAKPILYGGELWSNTRTWDGTAWVEIPGSHRPPAHAAALAYDPVRQVVVAQGGFETKAIVVNDTWTWDGTVWTEATSKAEPAPYRVGAAMTYDGRSGHVIFFGGVSK
jgi:hypothetical protein